MKARARHVRLVAACLAVALLGAPGAPLAKPLLQAAKLGCHCAHQSSHPHERHACCRQGIHATTCDCKMEAAPARATVDPTVVPRPMTSDRHVFVTVSPDAVVPCPSRLPDSPDPPPPIRLV